jgi:hypothetical protein
MDLIGIGTAVVGVVGKVIDKVFPDPVQAALAKAELVKLQQTGDLKGLEIRMSAIIAEAQSKDPWTSRARPSFLYVMYALILAAIPMGVLHAYNPELAVSIAAGLKAWLEALPEELWWLFGAGYLGYTGARTIDKAKGAKP